MHSAMQGGLAGLAATIPMTLLMNAWHRRLPFYERYPLPPRQITMRVARQAGVANRLDEPAREALTTTAHYGYGAGAGALYGLLCGRRAPVGIPNFSPGIPTGILYGLAVWSGSYLGLLPALGILPPATRHPRRRNALMIVAHLVWGGALGGATQFLKSQTEIRR